MSNPTYSFSLSTYTDPIVLREARPVYGSDLAKEIALVNGEQYYRESLVGKLTFVKDDFDFIMAQPFDAPIRLIIYIRYSESENYIPYWTGKFWRTDCTINLDDKTIEVSPSVDDRYTAVLNGLDKEYNLIDLLPAMDNICLDKRAMIQAYVPGQTTVACFLSGMWWEQDCEAKNAGQLNGFHFQLNRTFREAQISGTGSFPPYMGAAYDGLATLPFEATQNGWTLTIRASTATEREQMGWGDYMAFLTDGNVQYSNTTLSAVNVPTTITLFGGGAGTVSVYLYDTSVYMRIVCDVDTVGGSATHDIGANDMVANNRNYKKVAEYYNPSLLYFTTRTSSSPTKWGLRQPGVYYNTPFSVPSHNFFPLARNEWGSFSIWFAFDAMDWVLEPTIRKEYVLRDAYYLWSAINCLLAQFAPGIIHEGTTDYSQFLYGENPIDSREQVLFIVPKSNVIVAGYDQPAQKAPVTLRQILTMLRDCYRCYWWIDDLNRLRIEHISYFQRGGSYSGIPVVGIDLTEWAVERNGKKWSFGTSQYSFAKSEMPSRYEFGWMDDVTNFFEGFPIDIVSGYVNGENIESVQVQHFTSDIDYILLNPDAVSMDGFCLLAGEAVTGHDANFKVPYLDYQYAGGQYYLQNGYLSFYYLRRFYRYDLPAWIYEVDGEELTALGIKKQRTQSLRFPCLTDPDPIKLVKTGLGSGQIEKITVNLCSRNAQASLNYDTEQ